MEQRVLQNKALVTRLVDEVWNSKQPQFIEKFFAEDFATSTPGGVLYGPQGYRKIYDTYVQAFPDCQLKIVDLLGENDQIVVRFAFKGTHQGDFLGIKPTGRNVRIPGIIIMRIEEFKIVDQQVVWDTLSMLEQIQAISLENLP